MSRYTTCRSLWEKKNIRTFGTEILVAKDGANCPRLLRHMRCVHESERKKAQTIRPATAIANTETPLVFNWHGLCGRIARVLGYDRSASHSGQIYEDGTFRPSSWTAHSRGNCRVVYQPCCTLTWRS